MKIIYQSYYGVAVLSPADCGLTVLEIGQKDVPEGLPFWLVNEGDLPLDTPQEAWHLDELHWVSRAALAERIVR